MHSVPACSSTAVTLHTLIYNVYTIRYTLLHTAVMHQQTDCIPLVLSKGSNILALDAQGRSALQLACLCCNTATVQLLLDSGGWLDSTANDCLLYAVIGGSIDTVQLLLARGAVCTSAPIDSSGYTLLHAAAAWGRRDCTALLLRSGLLATATSVKGKTPIGLTVVAVPSLPAAVLPSDLSCTVVRCDDDVQAVMLLLLQCGAPVCAAMMRSNDMYAAAVEQRTEQMTRELQAANATLDIRASLAYGSSEQQQQQQQHCGTTVGSDATTVKVQLVHAETRVRGQRVYTVNTAELAQLYTARGEQGLNVLLSMLIPPESFRSAVDSAPAVSDGVKELHYNGKLCYTSLYHKHKLMLVTLPVAMVCAVRIQLL
jgi:ankyrin repeat protein